MRVFLAYWNSLPRPLKDANILVCNNCYLPLCQYTKNPEYKSKIYTNTSTVLLRHKYFNAASPAQILQRCFSGTNTSTVLLRHKSFNGASLAQILQLCFSGTNPSTVLLWHKYFNGASPAQILQRCFSGANT